MAMRRSKSGGSDWVEQQFGPVVDALSVEPLQKQFIRSRWMDQIRYLERRAQSAKGWHQSLRLIAIVGGVAIPALVGLNVGGDVSEGIRWGVFGLGLLVALATAVDAFFHHGDRWRHFRRTAELLKSEGWEFFQMAGPYAEFRNPEQAYPTFAREVETILQRDVEAFFTRVVRQPRQKKPEPEQ